MPNAPLTLAIVATLCAPAWSGVGGTAGPKPTYTFCHPELMGHFVTVRAARTAGPISRRVISEHVEVLRACYESEVPRVRSRGTVVLAVVVDATGAVKNAHVKSSTLRNATVEHCVLHAMPLAFPSGTPAVFELSIVFEPLTSR